MIYTAAIAMSLGAGDPITFLDRPPGDWDIELEVLRQARKLDSDRHSDEIKALGLSIGNRVAEAIGQMFR
jgi:hypothetical protein